MMVMNRVIFKNILFVSIYLGLALTHAPVHATNECGIASVAGTITCDGDSVPVSDANNYSNPWCI